jgi:phosphoribosyl-ATP pyrophosphohydrolase/phosphoribosyl-AMP cyclohydrolase
MLATINFDKLNGLVPVCIQDYDSLQVLMLGFMNEEAFKQTIETGKVTFFSRTKNRLWTKGETSGNELLLVDYALDCDCDSLLMYVRAKGPTCHTGETSCFNLKQVAPLYWFFSLFQQIIERKINPKEDSYTCKLYESGLPRITQKVGEEAVEVVIASLALDNESIICETVDLLYHLFVLLSYKDISLQQLGKVIQQRQQMRT